MTLDGCSRLLPLVVPAERSVRAGTHLSTSAEGWVPDRPCGPSGTTASLFHMIRVARDRIDHGDLLDREVGDDLDLLLVHDQHFLDAHAVAEALAVLGLQRERHAGLDLDRMVER